jgi:uncharacterized damage-inducible protein DinB
MKSTETLITHNIICLEQGVDLLRTLDDDCYTHTQVPLYPSSIGAHLRHGLEHYMSFLAGVDAGRIDYDARKRDLRIATSRAYATETSQGIIEGLKQLPLEDRSLLVKMDCDQQTEEEEVPWSVSSVKRDLQYLQAHTIHHYALIALILRLQGHEPGADFGVAPSTLRYRKQCQDLS